MFILITPQSVGLSPLLLLMLSSYLVAGMGFEPMIYGYEPYVLNHYTNPQHFLAVRTGFEPAVQA